MGVIFSSTALVRLPLRKTVFMSKSPVLKKIKINRDAFLFSHSACLHVECGKRIASRERTVLTTGLFSPECSEAIYV